MDRVTSLVLLAALVALAMWLRLLPSRYARVQGVDAWFYLLYAAALRQGRRLPARLSQFLMDIEEQWYPPAFAVVLACLPERLRLRARDWISPLFDVLQLGLVLLTAWGLGMGPGAILLAGLIYAVTPTLVSESSTLNSRSFASLILTVWMLGLIVVLTRGGWRWILVTGAAGALVLLTHKMATQMLAFLVAGFAIVEWRGEVLAVGLVAVAAAFVLSGGFYARVLQGHLAILRFWQRHQGNLSAHQIYDSPLYVSERRPDHGVRRSYAKGAAGAWRLLKVLIAHNPWAVLLPWLVALDWPGQFEQLLLLWAVVGAVAVVFMTFVGPLRFLGEGFRYLKFWAFPLAILTARAMSDGPAMLLIVPLVAVCAVAIWRFLWVRRFEATSEGFEAMVSLLRRDPRDRIATIPCHLSDPLAYLTGKKVLWGAHSAGYEKLECWFPVIQKPIHEVLDAFGVPLLLVDVRYVNLHDLRLDGNFRRVTERGTFVLLERATPSRAEAMPR